MQKGRASRALRRGQGYLLRQDKAYLGPCPAEYFDQNLWPRRRQLAKSCSPEEVRVVMPLGQPPGRLLANRQEHICEDIREIVSHVQLYLIVQSAREEGLTRTRRMLLGKN